MEVKKCHAIIFIFMAAVAFSAAGVLQPLQAASLDAVEAGQQEFVNNCAVCHGVDGKGTGPLRSSLKKDPPDLTVIAKNSGGIFPIMKVIDTIDGRAEVISHGAREMPIWGKAFREEDTLRTHGRILSLALYLLSIQIK